MTVSMTDIVGLWFALVQNHRSLATEMKMTAVGLGKLHVFQDAPVLTLPRHLCEVQAGMQSIGRAKGYRQ